VCGALARAGLYERANALCARMVEEHPDDAGAVALLGLGYYAAADPEAARPHLRRALELDPGRRNAAAVLARIEEDAPEPVPRGRRRAARSLIARIRAGEDVGDDGEAVPELVAALDDVDLGVRMDAGDALCVLGAPSVAPLIEVVRTGSTRAAERAMESLGAVGDLGPATEEARGAIVERVLADGELDPLSASHALKDLGAAEAFELWAEVVLRPGLDESDDAFSPRERASMALAFNHVPEALPVLATAIERFSGEGIESDWEVEDEIQVGLALVDDPAALDALVDLASHDCPGVRCPAAKALQQPVFASDPRARAALARLSDDPHPAVRRAAAG